MLPRVEGALLSRFLSSSLLPPGSHSHGLLSSAGPGSTRNRNGADPRNRRPEQVVELIPAHLLSRHLVKPRLLGQGRTRAQPSQNCSRRTPCPWALGGVLGRGLGQKVKSSLAR